MPFVVDASVSIEWLMPDESSALAEHALECLDGDEALAPGLWWFEVRNALLSAERRTRLTQDQTDAALAKLRRLPITMDHGVDDAVLMSLARRWRLTVYDAAYLELAQRLGLPLATLDRDLAKAADAAGVSRLPRR